MFTCFIELRLTLSEQTKETQDAKIMVRVRVHIHEHYQYDLFDGVGDIYRKVDL